MSWFKKATDVLSRPFPLCVDRGHETEEGVWISIPEIEANASELWSYVEARQSFESALDWIGRAREVMKNERCVVDGEGYCTKDLDELLAEVEE